MKFRTERKNKLRAAVDMVPLVNVVLLLLLFFILSSTFIVHSSIPIEMPQVTGMERPPALEDKDVSITLVKGEGGPEGLGPIYLDQDPIESMEDLSNQLSQRCAANPNLTLLILADQNARSGRLVEVMGIANNAGVRHFNIAAQIPEAVK